MLSIPSRMRNVRTVLDIIAIRIDSKFTSEKYSIVNDITQNASTIVSIYFI